jgi:hypothetical protein
VGSHRESKFEEGPFEEGPRDRLGLALSCEPLFSARLRALLATGVLALSFGAATASVASETDSEQEGVPAQPGDPGDQVGNGSAEETPLPVEVPVIGDPDQEAPGDETVTGPPGSVPLEQLAPIAVPGPDSSPVPEQAPPTAPSVPLPVAPTIPAPDADAGTGGGLVADERAASRQTVRLRARKSKQARRADKAPESGKAIEAGERPYAPPAAWHPKPAARRPHIRSGQRS